MYEKLVLRTPCAELRLELHPECQMIGWNADRSRFVCEARLKYEESRTEPDERGYYTHTISGPAEYAIISPLIKNGGAVEFVLDGESTGPLSWIKLDMYGTYFWFRFEAVPWKPEHAGPVV